MKIRIGKFFLNASEWVVAVIAFLGLFMILVCYVFGLTVFTLRTFF